MRRNAVVLIVLLATGCATAPTAQTVQYEPAGPCLMGMFNEYSYPGQYSMPRPENYPDHEKYAAVMFDAVKGMLRTGHYGWMRSAMENQSYGVEYPSEWEETIAKGLSTATVTVVVLTPGIDDRTSANIQSHAEAIQSTLKSFGAILTHHDDALYLIGLTYAVHGCNPDDTGEACGKIVEVKYELYPMWHRPTQGIRRFDTIIEHSMKPFDFVLQELVDSIGHYEFARRTSQHAP